MDVINKPNQNDLNDFMFGQTSVRQLKNKQIAPQSHKTSTFPGEIKYGECRHFWCEKGALNYLRTLLTSDFGFLSYFNP